jgi:hypothetical protein
VRTDVNNWVKTSPGKDGSLFSVFMRRWSPFSTEAGNRTTRSACSERRRRKLLRSPQINAAKEDE